MNQLPSQPEAARGAFSSFEACRNSQKGPVVILASGASASDFPLEAFADVPLIAMNGSIAMLEGTGIRPFFYVCTDRDFSNQQPELFASALRLSPRVALWPEQFDWLDLPDECERYPLLKALEPGFGDWLGGKEGPYVRNRGWWSKRARSIGFSKDLSHGFFDARTVMYVALQLAYHLGFETVLLVGVDLNQSLGRFYETGNVRRSPCGLDQHWEGRILPSLTLMARQVVGDRFRVYNLSVQSRISDALIPKIDVRQALALVSHRAVA
ncbi:lipopolysaccharide biosynthesis protein [Pseudomonas entomophila]|uniref:lipopolysaccharide biosynthesis protein n=1 Tax=Pseudomonas entomophila TaxID=312306 RepID=UPI0023D84FDC|nr:lipopolysaccharide biosynthesis protein [Pseudomonas entomophila]MDF0731792.1 lipopolysaccharide biosynthesis protein [Pseudomonas entomophila]